jgi:hypothetical protein
LAAAGLPWGVIVIGVIAVLALAWYVLFFTVALRETHHVYEFEPLTPQNAVEVTPYRAAMCEQAQLSGYAPAGELRHVKHKLAVTLLLSPDRRTIARVAGGTILGMQVKRTNLISRLTNGKVLSTTDEISLPDLTDLWSKDLVLHGNFQELRASHERWLAEAGASGERIRTFAQDPAAELQSIDVEDAARQEAFGYARFIDTEGRVFRLTVKGAWRQMTRGMSRSSAQAKAQQDRLRLPRPG